MNWVPLLQTMAPNSFEVNWYREDIIYSFHQELILFGFILLISHQNSLPLMLYHLIYTACPEYQKILSGESLLQLYFFCFSRITHVLI